MGFFDNILRFNYSNNLHQHLRGMSLDCESYSNQNFYQVIMMWLLVANLVMVLDFYYGLFNRPKLSSLLYWILNAFVTAFGLSFYAYMYASNGMYEGMHCSYLTFFKSDCILFGATIFVYSFLIWFVLSICLKWFSVNNKRVPF